jgi:SAM-dependent methyltransferase
MTSSGETTRRVRHPVMARVYRRVARHDPDGPTADKRRKALAGLRGRVLEVGVGYGINFPYYPSSVTELIALEPEPYLNRLAREEACAGTIPIRVTEGVAEDLPLARHSVDAAVVALVLCHVRDLERSIAELFRVIRPAGELRFYEHVRSPNPRFARVQSAADRIGLWRINGGCHAARDTLGAIRCAGFEIEACDQHRFRPFLLDYLSDPLVVGRARRPPLPGEAAPPEPAKDDVAAL